VPLAHHDSWDHILGNMLSVVIFGKNVEIRWAICAISPCGSSVAA